MILLFPKHLEGQGWEVLMLLGRLAHDEGTLREHPTRDGKADEGRPFCPRGNPRQLCERGRWLGLLPLCSHLLRSVGPVLRVTGVRRGSLLSSTARALLCLLVPRHPAPCPHRTPSACRLCAVALPAAARPAVAQRFDGTSLARGKPSADTQERTHTSCNDLSSAVSSCFGG